MSNKTYCNVCMTTQREECIAYCTLCGDTGQICHNCLHKWGKAGHDTRICTICKKTSRTMRNVPRLSPSRIVFPGFSITRPYLTTPILIMEIVQEGLLIFYFTVITVVAVAWTIYFLYVCWMSIFEILLHTLTLIEVIT